MATTKRVAIYANKVRKGQDYSKVKPVTVPNQSMTLQEILKRFVRRESLPVMKEGVYETRFGDLEKLQNEDITNRMETAAKLRLFVKKGEEMEAKRLEDLKRPPATPDPTPEPQKPKKNDE